LRWERSRTRGEKSDDTAGFEKFQELEKAETEVHIQEIGAQSDFTIRNEGTYEELLKAVDDVMDKIKQ
jgi:dephospho-CoA kinase